MPSDTFLSKACVLERERKNQWGIKMTGVQCSFVFNKEIDPASLAIYRAVYGFPPEQKTVLKIYLWPVIDEANTWNNTFTIS